MCSNVASSLWLDDLARLVRPQAERYKAHAIGLATSCQPEFADTTLEADPTKAYKQDDATGFIRLNGPPLKVAAKVHRER